MYSDWNHRAEAVCGNLTWYRLNELLAYTHKTREYIIHTIGKRSEAYASKLKPSPRPATREQRFPRDELYVCDGFGDWSRQIDQLLLLISIIFHPNKLERRYSGVESMGDAEMAFLDVVSRLLRETETLHNVIDQKEFESRYSLHWVEDDHRVPTAGGDQEGST